MATVDRKLEALTSALTPRERAILQVRSWRAGEKPDERLVRLCPPQDETEFRTLVGVVEHANDTLFNGLKFILEWLATVETEIHWLRTMTMYQVREKAMPAAERKLLPALPKVWSTKRTVLLGWGRAVDDEEEEPANWSEFVEKLVRDIRRSLGMRWQDYLDFDGALKEASLALGEEVAHEQVRSLLDGVRDGVLSLSNVMEDAGFPVELDDLQQKKESYAWNIFNWEVLRGTATEKHAREWMSASQLGELDVWEREQAEMLRNGS